MSLARVERARLADLLVAVGPDAPTLCAGWTTRDLAAHIVLRERRPDAALGIRVPALAGHTRGVQDRIAAWDWSTLVGAVRTKPVLLVGRLDELLNTAEMFVHAEDVRRAQPQPSPLPADPRREAVIERVLRRMAGPLFHRSPVGVVLMLPDGRAIVARTGTPSVTVTGPATELLLYAFGRTGHSSVQVDGEPSALTAFASTPLQA